jgi:hypothetical protein
MQNLENLHSPSAGISFSAFKRQFCHHSPSRLIQYIFHPTHCNRYELKTRAPQPVYVRFHHFLERLDIRSLCIICSRVSRSPILVVHTSIVRLSTSQRVETRNICHYASPALLSAHSAYSGCTVACDDRSFVKVSNACAFVYEYQVFRYRLYVFNSAYTAEIYAIDRALLFIRRSYLLCIDFIGALQSLQSHAPDHSVIWRFCGKFPLSWGMELCCGLLGTWPHKSERKGDRRCGRETANSARKFNIRMRCRVNLHDVVLSSWKDETNCAGFALLPMLHEGCGVMVVLFRTGHKCFTHDHFFRGDKTRVCDHCDVWLTDLHILRYSLAITSLCHAARCPRRLSR